MPEAANLKICYVDEVSVRGALRYARDFVKTLTEIIKFEPDLIYAHETAGDMTPALLMLLGGRNYILQVHDAVPHPGSDTKTFKGRGQWYRRSMRARSGSICTYSNGVQEALIQQGCRADKIGMIPHGLIGAPIHVRLPKEYDFTMVGRMEAYKGLDLFVEALELLAERNMHPAICVAGAGLALEELKKRFIRLPNSTVVARRLNSKELPQIISMSRSIVLPYREASQSGVAWQALALGVPVVATNVGGLGDFVREVGSGWLVPKCSAPSLAGVLEHLITTEGAFEEKAKPPSTQKDFDSCWLAIADQILSEHLSGLRRS